MGHRVLVVDIDPQGSTTSGLGVAKKGLENTTYRVLMEDDYDVSGAILNTMIENLDLLPASVELAGAEVEMVDLPARERRLQHALKPLRDQYEYIFIDCPPSLGLITINSLTAADSVLIPIQCEFYALEGLSQLMSTYNLVRRKMNPDLTIEGILLSMFDGRTNLSMQVMEEVKKHFKQEVYRTVIPRNVRLAEAPSYGLPIIEYDPRSAGAQAYMQLAEEFLKKEEEMKSRKQDKEDHHVE